ncbi:MAG: PP2C family protein-serine/threonine phosphatase [Phycisphaerales bacterium]
MPLFGDTISIEDKDAARSVDVELARVQRRGALTYAGIYTGFALFGAIAGVVAWRFGSATTADATAFGLFRSGAGLVLNVGAFLLLRRLRAPRRRIVGTFLGLAILSAIIDSAYWVMVPRFSPEELAPGGANLPIAPYTIALMLLLGMFIRSLVASVAVPLAARPALVLLGGMALAYGLAAAITLAPVNALAAVACMGGAFVAGLPGLWGTTTRYAEQVERAKDRYFGGRYNELRVDLAEARRLHSSLFPADLRGGRVELSYHYEPRREVGGDFLFAHRIDDDVVVAAVVDVTGHGIASALAVTRIHDELRRLTASPSATSPSAVIVGLHRFTQANLAPHNVYATAFCVVADAAEGCLRWCNAGHPPAFLRRAAGAVDMLESTAMMLGATQGEPYDVEERESPFAPGDTLVVFTDGVIEADAELGRAFGVDRARRAVQDADGRGPAQSLMDAVRAHRETHASDDALAVEVIRVM